MEELQGAYIAIHLLAAVANVLVALLVRDSVDGTTRRWFLAFIGLSVVWSTLEAVRIALGAETVAAGLYIASLVVGLYTVPTFVVFTSVVTGRSVHTDRRVQIVGTVTLLGITALKTTNPIHGEYFTLTLVETPFPHFAVQLGPIHWVVTSLAYVTSGVGVYYLYDFFQSTDLYSRRLAVLVGLFPVPLALTAVSQYGPTYILNTFYEPIGVALFALAVAWTVKGNLGQVEPQARKHLIQQVEFPVAIVDGDVVIDSNERFDAFADSGSLTGTRVESLPESLREVLTDEQEYVALSYDGTRQIYRPSITEVTLGPHQLARAVVLFDVSQESRQIAEIRRQNRELENIGEVLAHELRNTSAIITGYLRTVVDDLEDASSVDAVQRATGAAERIDTVVGNLLSTIEHSRSVTSYERINVKRICSQFDATGVEVSIADDRTLVGDTTRVEYLFENVFEFARATETSAVRIEMATGSLCVTFVGAGVTPEESDHVFDHGQSIPHAEAGMYLPTVGLIADAHHWCPTATIRTTADGSRELVVTIETDPPSSLVLEPDTPDDRLSGDSVVTTGTSDDSP